MSPSARKTWLPLGALARSRRHRNAVRPMCIAIAGAQGSGKTTLAEILTEQLLLSRRAAP